MHLTVKIDINKYITVNYAFYGSNSELVTSGEIVWIWAVRFFNPVKWFGGISGSSVMDESTLVSLKI